MVKSSRISGFYIAICSFVISLAVAVFPGKSALEGDQRNIPDITDKSDNWGFFTAFFYGEWPNFLGEWRFTLIVFQLAISVSGFLMLTKDFRPKGSRQVVFYVLLFFVSSMFSIQLSRDASLYAFSLIGFGLINISYNYRSKTKVALIFCGWLFLFLASMFKPILSLALLPLLTWLLWQIRNTSIKKTLKVFLIPLFLLATLPSVLDQSLIRVSKMQSVYPEQQPVILDLAMNYCWGQSDSIRTASKLALEAVVRPSYPVESICAATNPFRWDDLHSDPKDWIFSNPISRLTGESASPKVRKLILDWVSIVIANPADWLQVRLLVVGPVLLMSNSFANTEFEKANLSIFDRFSNSMWTPLYFFVGLIDKLRITSLFFLLAFQFFLLINYSNMRFDQKSKMKGTLAFSFLASTISFSLATLTFLAPNGRYILPYITLNYILLYRALSKNSQTRITSK